MPNVYILQLHAVSMCNVRGNATALALGRGVPESIGRLITG